MLAVLGVVDPTPAEPQLIPLPDPEEGADGGHRRRVVGLQANHAPAVLLVREENAGDPAYGDVAVSWFVGRHLGDCTAERRFNHLVTREESTVSALQVLATDRLDRLVEALQKTRSVTLLQRRRSARYLSRTTELRQQVTSRNGETDVVFRERLSGSANDARALLEAATCQRNVSGDHDVVGLHVLDNPVIGRIEIVPHDFQFNPPFVRNPHPGVGHQGDVEVISACNAVHLLFDRARISIDKDMEQKDNLFDSSDSGLD